MSPEISCASTLPGKTEKHENHIFHSNGVLVHCLNSTSRFISSFFLTHNSYARPCSWSMESMENRQSRVIEKSSTSRSSRSSQFFH